MLGAQSSVPVNSQDMTQHRPQPPQLQPGYHPSLPPQQSPYMNQPGINQFLCLLNSFIEFCIHAFLLLSLDITAFKICVCICSAYAYVAYSKLSNVNCQCRLTGGYSDGQLADHGS